ncbi:YkgJ family cysteine cluster protein [Ferruginibacter lapsinanis]|uniref:YkgJ family cysteine cluster protein n=1 Tax=Ferruginibacter lapsinanis TaxID=563172 RepID=UPI001E3788E9|nr:YkgJ family cysteine cluster protein [Ferruginibacter lapsinanis]UEG49752.1 YkgJ family cysteine cluster protein [Ferruginibacter lapsinanis]
MQPINLRSFKQKVRINKRRFKSFLTKLEKNPPRGLHKTIDEIDKAVWAETDCLSCGNCCKTMTPTFTPKDIKRISAHFEMTPAEFKDKWLMYEKRDGDWQNKKQPCQFLNLKDNKCSIYEIRPADCAGFPHLTRKKTVDYIHVHQQNIEYCPATYNMVERLKLSLSQAK